jgi:hypothetical protein
MHEQRARAAAARASAAHTEIAAPPAAVARPERRRHLRKPGAAVRLALPGVLRLADAGAVVAAALSACSSSISALGTPCDRDCRASGPRADCARHIAGCLGGCPGTDWPARGLHSVWLSGSVVLAPREKPEPGKIIRAGRTSASGLHR